MDMEKVFHFPGTRVRSIKVVIVGEGGVGKTALLLSYTTDKFPSGYYPTVFDNYSACVMIDHEAFNMGFFDTAGQEDYDRLRCLSYPNADVFIVCYSVDNPTSLEMVAEKWIYEIKHHCPNTPFILLGNKIDMRNNSQDLEYIKRFCRRGPLTYEEGQNMARRVEAAGFVECSALTKSGMREAFEMVYQAALSPMPVRKRRPLFPRISFKWVKNLRKKWKRDKSTTGSEKKEESKTDKDHTSASTSKSSECLEAEESISMSSELHKDIETDDFRKIWTDQEKLNLVQTCSSQILFTGKSMSGKTSIIRSLLLGENYTTKESERTVLMGYKCWRITDKVTAILIDLGDHPSHEHVANLFYSNEENNIVVIAHKLKSSDYNYCFKWLNKATQISPSCQVCFTLTHADEMQDKAKRVKKKDVFLKNLSTFIKDEIRASEVSQLLSSDSKFKTKQSSIIKAYNKILGELPTSVFLTSCVDEHVSNLEGFGAYLSDKVLDCVKYIPEVDHKLFVLRGCCGIKNEVTETDPVNDESHDVLKEEDIIDELHDVAENEAVDDKSDALVEKDEDVFMNVGGETDNKEESSNSSCANIVEIEGKEENGRPSNEVFKEEDNINIELTLVASQEHGGIDSDNVTGKEKGSNEKDEDVDIDVGGETDNKEESCNCSGDNIVGIEGNEENRSPSNEVVKEEDNINIKLPLVASQEHLGNDLDAVTKKEKGNNTSHDVAEKDEDVDMNVGGETVNTEESCNSSGDNIEIEGEEEDGSPSNEVVKEEDNINIELPLVASQDEVNSSINDIVQIEGEEDDSNPSNEVVKEEDNINIELPLVHSQENLGKDLHDVTEKEKSSNESHDVAEKDEDVDMNVGGETVNTEESCNSSGDNIEIEGEEEDGNPSNEVVKEKDNINIELPLVHSQENLGKDLYDVTEKEKRSNESHDVAERDEDVDMNVGGETVNTEESCNSSGDNIEIECEEEDCSPSNEVVKEEANINIELPLVACQEHLANDSDAVTEKEKGNNESHDVAEKDEDVDMNVGGETVNKEESCNSSGENIVEIVGKEEDCSPSYEVVKEEDNINIELPLVASQDEVTKQNPVNIFDVNLVEEQVYCNISTTEASGADTEINIDNTDHHLISNDNVAEEKDITGLKVSDSKNSEQETTGENDLNKSENVGKSDIIRNHNTVGKTGNSETCKEKKADKNHSPTDIKNKTNSAEINGLLNEASEVNGETIQQSINRGYNSEEISTTGLNYLKYIDVCSTFENILQEFSNHKLPEMEQEYLNKHLKGSLGRLHSRGLLIWHDSGENASSVIFNDIASFVDMLTMICHPDHQKELTFEHLSATGQLLFNNNQNQFSVDIKMLYEQGILRKRLLYCLLLPFNFQGNTELVLDMLERKGVCFRIDNDHSKMVSETFLPWLCNKKASSDIMDRITWIITPTQTSLIKYIVFTGRISLALFHLLLVAIYKKYKENSETQLRQIWSNGFWAHLSSAVLFMLFDENKAITIVLKADIQNIVNAKYFWDQIRFINQTIDELSQERWPGVLTRKSVACNHCLIKSKKACANALKQMRSIVKKDVKISDLKEECFHMWDLDKLLGVTSDKVQTCNCAKLRGTIPAALLHPLPYDSKLAEQSLSSLQSYLKKHCSIEDNEDLAFPETSSHATAHLSATEETIISKLNTVEQNLTGHITKNQAPLDESKITNKALAMNYQPLVENIMPDEIVGTLYSKLILTIDEMQLIESEETTSNKVRRILYAVNQAGDDGVKELIVVLQEKGQGHLAKLFTEN